MGTHRRLFARVIASALFAVALAGCSTSSSVAPGTNPPPNANSPVNLVRRIEWDWNQRSDDYVRLLTADFRYVPAEGDSAGDTETIWDRETESFVAQRMFVRSGGWPQMNSLSFQLDRGELVAMPDTRPGKNPRWHKVVSSNAEVSANFTFGGPSPEVYLLTGHFTFYCVRGDSAQIPPELQREGVTPDSTRWWIERWEDESILATEPGMHPDPARTATFTGLKNQFLPIR